MSDSLPVTGARSSGLRARLMTLVLAAVAPMRNNKLLRDGARELPKDFARFAAITPDVA